MVLFVHVSKLVLITSVLKYISMDIKVISINRKAKFEYSIIETFEAGMVLQGSEIKSIRAGQVSLQEAYVRTDGKQAWLVGANIAPYEHANLFNHEPTRERNLLLHHREIKKMWNEVRIKGMTLIPMKIYLKGGRAKIEVGVAKGKKMYDKRESIKKRDLARDDERRIQRK